MHIAFLNPQGNFNSKDSYLTEHADFGGQLVYVKEVCMALARMDVRVDIVTRRIDDPQWQGFAEQLAWYTEDGSGPRIVRIDCGGEHFLRKEHLWPHLGEWVDNIIAFYGDDLPAAFTAHYADAGYSAALMKKKTGRGFTFTGHSLGAQKLDKLGMTPENADAMEAEYCFSQRIAAERMAMQHAFRIITSTRQERLDQYGHALYSGAVDVHDDTRFAVIPPGVNGRLFSRQAGPLDDEVHDELQQQVGRHEGPYIIASSRLDEKKNILGIAQAYAQSGELQRQARLGIFLRGLEDPFADISALPEGEQAVLRPILDTILEAGLRDRVDFFDIRSQQALASAYRYFAERGSVFALTAFYEPFGLAPIEAAACGLAVVATRNGGPTEIFADGSAVLVDPFDAQDIARGLGDCLERSAELSARAIERVRST
ncbi:MAG: glycosyltransferase, partial [Thiohalobacterales bacterium]|nr:glycosyltransferase [Thiohalobacterales bacterium]